MKIGIFIGSLPDPFKLQKTKIVEGEKMKNPTAHEFLQAWREVTALRQNELLENWHKRRKYTSLIQGEEGCIVEEVGRKLDKLDCYSEYYHTDTIFYAEADLVPERAGNQTWFRGIRVAFEHEHSYDKNLYEEISHLLILHSKLSVLVTYPPGRHYMDAPNLEYFRSIIKGSPRGDELDANENFLLILGY